MEFIIQDFFIILFFPRKVSILKTKNQNIYKNKLSEKSF